MFWEQVFSLSIYHGYIPQILLAEALYVIRLKRRDHFWVRLGIGLPVCVFLAIVVPNMVAMLTSGLFSMIIFLLTFGLCCFLFKNKWTETLFCCVSAQFTQNLAYNIEALIESSIEEGLNVTLTMRETFAISVTCMVAIYVLVYLSFARRIQDIKMDGRYVLPMSVITLLFVYEVQYLLQVYGIDRIRVSRLPLIVCCIFGLCLQYGMLAYKSKQAEKEKLELFLRQETKHYEITRRSIDLLNMKAHDLKHYLNNASDAMYNKDYLEEIKAGLEEYESAVNCGNSMLNVILTEKQFQCNKHNISFTMMVHGEELKFVHRVDLVAIFSNAIENAIECELGLKKSKRSISLRAIRKGDIIVIHIENYCPHKIKIKDGIPVSTKGNSDLHGYGFKSIKYAVKKYGGQVQATQENDMFILDILLPCPQINNKSC